MILSIHGPVTDVPAGSGYLGTQPIVIASRDIASGSLVWLESLLCRTSDIDLTQITYTVRRNGTPLGIEWTDIPATVFETWGMPLQGSFAPGAYDIVAKNLSGTGLPGAIVATTAKCQGSLIGESHAQSRTDLFLKGPTLKNLVRRVLMFTGYALCIATVSSAQSVVTPGMTSARSALPTACVNPTTFVLESCGGSGGGGGGLTDAELRASPVPMSIVGTVPVSGPLTDTQLRATPVPVSGTVTASGPLTDTQLRATPVPVSGTVTANAGTGNFTVIQATGTNLHIVCDSGCSGAVQNATYTAQVTSSASAATKDYLSVFNASGSGRVVRVTAIRVAQGNTAAIVGLNLALNVIRTSTVGTTCTAVTVQNNIDTNNAAVPAQITANTNCTTDPTTVSTISHCALSTEETAVGGPLYPCYRFENNGGQPITLREGQGVMLLSTALAPVGLVSASIEMTITNT